MGKPPNLVDGAGDGSRRDLLWAAVAFVAFVAVSLGLLISANPSSRRTVIGRGDYSLTIVHTNDTWGYLDPCG